MNESNVLKTREVRCSACKLPPDVLAALHYDRFEDMLPFEELVRKYSLPDRPLSESGIRRHFARHAAPSEDAGTADEATVEPQPEADGSTSCAVGDDLDAHALLEAGTRTLAEMVQGLAEEYRAAVQQRPQAAERAFGKFMKAQTALARCVKQLEEGGAVRDEFRKTVPQIVGRCTSAAMRSILPLMRERAKLLREEVAEFSQGTLSAEEFWNRLIRYEVEWPKEIATRMKAAQTEALKGEEAKVQG